MKLNDDGKTVRAMDVLFPKIGEIIGGSQREESLEKLQKRVDELGLTGMEWYLDTRRFGTVPHSGFGLGFERLVLFVTGMQNIRDVIPLPRYPNNCAYCTRIPAPYSRLPPARRIRLFYARCAAVTPPSPTGAR